MTVLLKRTIIGVPVKGTFAGNESGDVIVKSEALDPVMFIETILPVIGKFVNELVIVNVPLLETG